MFYNKIYNFIRTIMMDEIRIKRNITNSMQLWFDTFYNIELDPDNSKQVCFEYRDTHYEDTRPFRHYVILYDGLLDESVYSILTDKVITEFNEVINVSIISTQLFSIQEPDILKSINVLSTLVLDIMNEYYNTNLEYPVVIEETEPFEYSLYTIARIIAYKLVLISPSAEDFLKKEYNFTMSDIETIEIERDIYEIFKYILIKNSCLGDKDARNIQDTKE